MRIRITLELDNEDRRALARYYGERGLATRATARAFFVTLIEETLADMVDDADTPEDE